MMSDPQAISPHCDPSILHAPGECQYCDAFPLWQELRDLWRISFTGHLYDGCTPCPSVWFRDELVRDLWAGNKAEPS